MAPTLRSSRRVETQPCLPPSDVLQTEHEDDEEMQSGNELNTSELEDDIMDTDMPSSGSHEPHLQSSAQELLRPLQETADRVSRQVEEFAQALDKFNKSRDLSGQELWNETWLLMDIYSHIANSSAERMKTTAVGGRQSQKSRKSLGDSNVQKQNLMLEAHLWQLESQLLPCSSPDMVEETQFRQNTALAELHRYSTNVDLWTAFINVDRVAMQYEALLDWLQEWKTKISPPLTDTDLEYYDKTQRGEASWDGGNIFTQGPIKRQKIARAHPGPLPANNDMRQIHYRRFDQRPLVTQMDPDVALRQDGVLENEDELYEYSAWHASWELLRRGSTTEDVCSWWRERNQLWRAVALRNSSLQTETDLNKAWLRIVNLASNRSYAKLCHELASNEDLQTDYENAVYSILSGQYEGAIPVCKSIDDHLFALVNALLTDRYEQFLAAYQKKLQAPKEIAYTPPPTTMERVAQYVKNSQLNKTTKVEAHQPHKYLQSMVMSNDLGKFLLDMGHAAAQMAYVTGQAKALFDPDDSQVNECAQVAAQDEDIVRIAVHLQLAVQPLGMLDGACKENASVLENNIVNYIGLLERHAKYAILPLYASKLSLERQPRVLGRILSKVTEPKERDTQMRLMKSYGIPVYRVIYTICDYTRRTWVLKLGPEGKDLRSAKIIQYNDRIVQIRPGFMGEMANEDEAHVVQAHEWVNYIDTKNWGMAVWLMTALYKTLLLSGKLAAAKALSERVELGPTSLKVTGMNLSLAAIIQNTAEEDENEDMEEDVSRLASPTKRRKDSRATHPLVRETTNRNVLADQSVTWAHLENLVGAMDALELWQDLADQVGKLPRNDLRSMKSAKKELSTALQGVRQAMQPLLEYDFLNNPADEQEDRDLAEIRNHYLPECILAYNSALYFAGHAISRQHLVQCMDLAQQVAQNDSLTRAFTESKRMQELVTAFAFDSQALLRANEHGSNNSKTRGGKRVKDGEISGRPDIWQVTMTGDGAD